MNKKIIMKLLTLAVICMFVLSFAMCFATSSNNEAAFVSGLTDALAPDNLWGALVPMVTLIAGIFIFAFVYGRIRKITKKGSNGKFGM